MFGSFFAQYCFCLKYACFREFTEVYQYKISFKINYFFGKKNPYKNDFIESYKIDCEEAILLKHTESNI